MLGKIVPGFGGSRREQIFLFRKNNSMDNYLYYEVARNVPSQVGFRQ